MSTALVLGGAVSGRAAAALLTARGHSVRIFDERAVVVEQLRSEGIKAIGAPWTDDLLDGVDLVVTSPGWPPVAAPIVAAQVAGVPLVSEIELALDELDCPVVAVTGTNGKTTVAELIAEMGRAGGLNTVAAGNIGTPLTEIVADSWDAVVVEMSSFQLYYTDTLHPTIAVVLNVAPDHLDWHGSFDAYRTAKARIFAQQSEDDLVIYDADDRGARELVEDAPSKKIGVSGRRLPPGGFGVDLDELVLAGGTVSIDTIQADDPTYFGNLVAAAVAADRLGVSHESISDVIRKFTPSAHRRTLVGEWSGVRWIDDSKATNPHAALAAVAAYDSVVLIAGGRNKGLDLAPLATAHSVRFMIAIGESAGELLAASGERPARVAASMADAVSIADSVAATGDVVLLAPGCASFDMFSSYGERGEVFVNEVRAMKEQR